MTPRRARWIAVAGVVALACAAQAAGLVPALRYDRAAIAAGEAWRLLTGHLVHLGAMHLALNAAGLVLVAALVGPHMRLPAWGTAFVVSALAISAGLWLVAPGLDWYVGLSGVLHGLLVAGAAAAIGERRERLFAGTVLAAVAAKLVWEQTTGPTPGTAALAGGPVVVDAHLFGALGGLATALGRLAWRRATGPGNGSLPGPGP